MKKAPYLTHAIVAHNEAVVAAGEVRFRSLCVRGKWLKVIDISNDTGHYQANASSLPGAVKAFEHMGYIVHRVNAIHTKISTSFNKVDADVSFPSLNRRVEN